MICIFKYLFYVLIYSSLIYKVNPQVQTTISILSNNSGKILGTALRQSTQLLAFQKYLNFSVSVYEPSTTTQLFIISTQLIKAVCILQFSQSGNTLAIGGQDFSLQLWNTTTNNPVLIKRIQFEDYINSFQFESNSQDKYVIGLNDGSILWIISNTTQKYLSQYIPHLFQVIYTHNQQSKQVHITTKNKFYTLNYNQLNDTLNLILNPSGNDYNIQIENSQIVGVNTLIINIILNFNSLIMLNVAEKSTNLLLKNYILQSKNSKIKNLDLLQINFDPSRAYLLVSGKQYIEILQLRQNNGNLNQPILIFYMAYFQNQMVLSNDYAKFFKKNTPLTTISFAFISNNTVYYLNKDLPNKNMSPCLQGQYFMNSSQCTLCPQGCQTCLSQTLCSSCKKGYKINNTTNSCQKCNINNCVNCTNGLNTCSGCHLDYQYSVAGTNISCKSCFQINPFCQRCYSAAASTAVYCITCLTGYVLVSTNNCIKCSTFLNQCAKCISQSLCIRCKIGYFIPSVIGNNCSICSSSCLSCQFSSNNCTSCYPTYFYNQSSNTCSCIQPKIQNPIQQKCILCNINNCLRCSDINYCQLCNDNRTAINDTLNNPYNLIIGSCSIYCSVENCIKCQIDNICIQCAQGYIISNESSCYPFYFNFQKNNLNCIIQLRTQEQNNNIHFLVKFNNPYGLLQPIKQSFKIYLNNQQKMPYQFSQQTLNNKLRINLQYNQSYQRLIIYIQINNTQIISFNTKQNLLNQNFTFNLNQVFYTSPQDKDQISIIRSLSIGSCQTGKYAFGIYLFSGALSLILNLIVLFQILPLYLFLDAKLPQNLKSFLQELIKIQVQGMMPFQLPQFLSDFTNPQELPYKYTQYGLSNNFISQNKEDIIVLFFYIFLTIVIGFIARKWLPNGKIKGYLFQRFYRQRYDQCFSQFQGSYLTFIFSASLIIFHSERIQKYGQVANLFIAYLIFVMCFLSAFIHLFIVLKRKQQQYSIMIIEESLQGYSWKNQNSIHILTYQNLMNCFICGFIGTIHPLSMLIIILGLNIKMIYYYWKNQRIFESKIFWLLKIVSNSAFLAFNILFIFLWINSQDNLLFLNKQNLWILGYFGLTLIGVMIFMGILQVFIGTSFSIYIFLKKNKIKSYNQQLKQIKQAQTMKTLGRQNKEKQTSQAKVNSMKKIRIHDERKTKNDNSRKKININYLKQKKQVRIITPISIQQQVQQENKKKLNQKTQKLIQNKNNKKTQKISQSQKKYRLQFITPEILIRNSIVPLELLKKKVSKQTKQTNQSNIFSQCNSFTSNQINKFKYFKKKQESNNSSNQEYNYINKSNVTKTKKKFENRHQKRNQLKIKQFKDYQIENIDQI